MTEALQEKLAELDGDDADFLRECVTILPEDIQTQFEEIPGQLAYWNAQYGKALRAHLNAEIDVKVTRARVYNQLIDGAIAAGGKKPTEEHLKALVEANEDYIQMQYASADAEAKKNDLYGKLDAIRSKKEMLVSLGAHLRAEMGGDPLIRETAGARRRLG
jgi:hypothetical protein